MKKITTSLLFIFILFAAVAPHTTHAESYVWTKTYDQNLYSNFGNRYYLTLKKPSVQIKYAYSVRNNETGELYACGDNVPVGTEITFEYKPHEYTDVFWFGTGSAFDSPYGSWVSGANRSSTGMCTEKNYYFTETGTGFVNYTKHYADLAMNPPQKIITGVSGENCYTVDGQDKTCTFNEEGQVNAVFGFGETYGKFYHGYAHKLIDRGICKVNPGASVTINNNTSAKFIHFYNGEAQRISLATHGHTGFSKPAGSADPVTTFTVNVPAQTLACPINIINPEGTAPTAPTIGGDRACRTGVSNTYTFTGSDPDTTPETSLIRYAIDWDNDGSVDQLLPASGYVTSLTTLSAQHTWKTPGAKTFRAKTQDKQGLSSAWNTYTTDECVGEIIRDDGLDRDTYGTYPDGEVSFDLKNGLTNNKCVATWEASYVSSCSLLRNGIEFMEGIDTAGELELSPGVYQIKCNQLKDGAVLSSKKSCVMNPNIREV